jgi:hypothetical protein
MLRRLTAGALVALVFISSAAAGPSCTIEYPRGFKIPKGTKKKPLVLCTGGDLQTTWGAVCVSRFNA